MTTPDPQPAAEALARLHQAQEEHFADLFDRIDATSHDKDTESWLGPWSQFQDAAEEVVMLARVIVVLHKTDPCMHLEADIAADGSLSEPVFTVQQGSDSATFPLHEHDALYRALRRYVDEFSM